MFNAEGFDELIKLNFKDLFDSIVLFTDEINDKIIGLLKEKND